MEAPSQMLLLTLPQVIDAALTGPEMGIVSYRLLNNILQVMCQQMDLSEVKVQYQGTQAQQIQKIWDPNIKSKIPGITSVKKVSTFVDDADKGERMVVIPDGPSDKFPAVTLAITTSQLQNIERNIRSLQKEVADLRALPSNSELFRAVKSKGGDPTPIMDMYQILSLTKRMDATEQAVMKIASFVEDLAKFIQGDESVPAGQMFEIRPADQQSGTRVVKSQGSKVTIVGPSGGPASEGGSTPALEGKSISSSKGLSGQLDLGVSATKLERQSRPTLMIKGNIGEEGFTEGRLKSAKTSKEKASDGSADSSESKGAPVPMIQLPPSKLSRVNIADMPSLEAFTLVQEELKSLRGTVQRMVGAMTMTSSTGPLAKGGVGGIQTTTIEVGKGEGDQTLIEMKVNECIAQINRMDSIFSTSYNGITNRIADLESSFKLMSNRALQDSGKGDMEEQLSQSIYTVNEKVMELENVVSKQSDVINLLLEDNATNQSKIMSLMDDVDLLKADKIGREEFTEALAEKVDLCMINRKVSHDQFNATCDDLSKGIEEALEKLMEQEDLWHVALKEIQEEISEKLGKDDLTPLKVFVVDKLKGLQHRVKTLMRLKQEQEAAATKSKFLKGVQCISCDKDVIMRKKLDEATNYPGAPVLPTHKSIAPYLAYELDQLRKQQQSLQYSKNLHHFESATQDSKGIVNRYCGGPHTITTPQQRVSRLGNFVEQWGPKVVQVNEEQDIQFCYSKPSDKCSRTDEKRVRISRASLIVKQATPLERQKDRAEKDDNRVLRKSYSDIMTSLEKVTGLSTSAAHIPGIAVPSLENVPGPKIHLPVSAMKSSDKTTAHPASAGHLTEKAIESSEKMSALQTSAGHLSKKDILSAEKLIEISATTGQSTDGALASSDKIPRVPTSAGHLSGTAMKSIEKVGGVSSTAQPSGTAMKSMEKVNAVLTSAGNLSSKVTPSSERATDVPPSSRNASAASLEGKANT